MTHHRSAKKVLLPVLLFSLTVLLISACSKSAKEQTAPGAETKAAETKTEAMAATEPSPAAPVADKYSDWVEYGSEPHLFTILTPKSFEVSRDKTQTAAGEIELITYLAELGSVAYGVVCNDFPPDFMSKTDPSTLLKNGSNGFVNQFSGKVSGEQVLSLEGHPGLEITLTGVTQGIDIFAKGRFYLVGDRLYQVTVIAEKGKEDLEAINKFLGSFKLKT